MALEALSGVVIRIISARLAALNERKLYGESMKEHYDFSKGKRGRVVAPEPEPRGKVRTTIRIDEDLVDAFLKQPEESGGSVGYQTLINDALRQHVEGRAPKLEDTLRLILREEIRAAS